MSKALEDVAAERRRQVEAEGWTQAHDDAHSMGEMGRAAACYALSGARPEDAGAWPATLAVRLGWPWGWSWWKPKDRRSDLIRAGALIIAEIERLDRRAAAGG